MNRIVLEGRPSDHIGNRLKVGGHDPSMQALPKESRYIAKSGVSHFTRLLQTRCRLSSGIHSNNQVNMSSALSQITQGALQYVNPSYLCSVYSNPQTVPSSTIPIASQPVSLCQYVRLCESAHLPLKVVPVWKDIASFSAMPEISCNACSPHVRSSVQKS